MTASDAPHGTSKRYDHGTRTTPPCRCELCGRAKVAARERQRRLAWSGRSLMVDAAPVRAHVEKLYRESGLGVKRIALLAGVSQSSVRGLLGLGRRPGPARLIRRDTAAKLLAVSPALDDLADQTLVDACGSRRRLQALVAGGRPLLDITDTLGLNKDTVNGLVHARRPTVRAATACAIRDATARLVEQPPPQRTVEQRRRAAAARRLAARHGWLPFGVWADIDDPAAEPEVDEDFHRGRDDDTHIVDAFLAERVTWDEMRPVDRRLVARWCRRRDWTQAKIAERGKTRVEAVSHYFHEARDVA